MGIEMLFLHGFFLLRPFFVLRPPLKHDHIYIYTHINFQENMVLFQKEIQI